MDIPQSVKVFGRIEGHEHQCDKLDKLGPRVRADQRAGRGVPGGGRAAPGRAVQVEAIKPMLKPPGTKLLILKCDVLVSTSAFTFKLRRYTLARLRGF